MVVQHHFDHLAGAAAQCTGWPTSAATWTVPQGAKVRLHVVGAFDKPRNHVLTVHGMDWPEHPWRGARSPRLCAEGGLSVGTVRTLHLHLPLGQLGLGALART